MKKGFPEEDLYKLRSGMNWEKRGKRVLVIGDTEKQTHRPCYGGCIGETEESSVLSAHYRLCNMIGNVADSYPANKEMRLVGEKPDHASFLCHFKEFNFF